jgi:hypothetical protein
MWSRNMASWVSTGLLHAFWTVSVKPGICTQCASNLNPL